SGTSDAAEGQSDDPLKYRPPREPRKGHSLFGNKSSASSASGSGGATAAASVAASSAKAPAPAPAADVKVEAAKQEVKRPQFLFSARVRLFKLNPSSRSYEPWCNGELLGCVF